VISSKKELSMQVPGIGLVDAVPAVTLASIAAEVLATSLPQPNYIALWPGSRASVSFQFSVRSGDARFGYVSEWADFYGVQVLRSDHSHAAVFSLMGVEFNVYAPNGEPE
jgi:hypothetical protein